MTEEEREAGRYERLRIAVWKWLIDANNGVCADPGDLQWTLERMGASCPESLKDE